MPPYVNITLDVGASVSAFKMVWTYPEQYKNIVIHLGSFHFLKENFQVIGIGKIPPLLIKIVIPLELDKNCLCEHCREFILVYLRSSENSSLVQDTKTVLSDRIMYFGEFTRNS
jgi:hypothetical protein